MKNVPGISEDDTNLTFQHDDMQTTSARAESFCVEVPKGTNAVITLKLGIFNNRNFKNLVLLLSPAAAKQISKELNRGVKTYLKGANIESEDD